MNVNSDNSGDENAYPRPRTEGQIDVTPAETADSMKEVFRRAASTRIPFSIGETTERQGALKRAFQAFVHGALGFA